jgi:hypothetical protein
VRWVASTVILVAACGRLDFGGTGASVQAGRIMLAASDTEVTVPISPVDPAISLLVFSVAVDSTDVGVVKVAGELVGSDSVLLERVGTGAPATVAWQVVTWNGWSVRRGATTLPTPDLEVVAAISPPVDASHGVVIATCFGNGTLFNDDDFLRASLDSGSQVRFDIGNPGTDIQIRWQAVELPGATVQAGVTDVAEGAATTTVAISAVDPDHSWLVYSYSANGIDPGNASSMLIEAQLAAPDQLAFDRTGTVGTGEVSWFVVEDSAAAVQHGVQGFVVGQLASTAALASIEPASAFSYGGGLGGTSSTTAHATDGNPGTAWAATLPSGPTSLDLERASSTDDASVAWTVIQLR